MNKSPGFLYSKIASTGRSLPEVIISNQEVEERCDLESGWIEQRTGIRQRPVVKADQSVSDLAIAAGRTALSNWDDRSFGSIGMLILATSTPDYLLPPTAPYVASQLDLGPIPAFDIAVACCGFLYAMQIADSYCRSYGRPVLLIAGNVLSKRVSRRDPSTAAIFADGAGAVVVEPSDHAGLLSIELASDGSEYDALLIPHGGSKHPFDDTTLNNDNHTMKVNNGMAVFRYAVESMTHLGKTVLDRAGRTVSDVDFWIPHQANLRIIESVRQRLGISEDKTGVTIDQFANSSAATIPTALDYFRESGRIEPGNLILMTAAAAGLTSGAALVKLSETS